MVKNYNMQQVMQTNLFGHPNLPLGVKPEAQAV